MLFGLNIWEYSFKGLWLFFGVYLGATLFAALLTPPVYLFAQFLNETFATETTKWLVGKGVDTFYDRLRWIPIVVGLPWVLGKCGLLSFKNLGLSFDADNPQKFFKFFATGAGVALLVFALQFFYAGAGVKDGVGFGAVAGAMLAGLFGALILGFLEELVFRALIMRSFYTAFGALSAVILSSLFFAYKHFKVPSDVWQNIPGGEHAASWDTGFFVAYYDTIGVFINFNPLVFFTLFALGVLLCLMYLYTRSLGAPIAFHAGAVWVIAIFRKLFTPGPAAHELRDIFGGKALTDGYVPLAALCVLCIAFFALIWLRQRNKIYKD